MKTKLKSMSMTAFSLITCMSVLAATPGTEVYNKSCVSSHLETFQCDVVKKTCYRLGADGALCTGPDPTPLWTDICLAEQVPATIGKTEGILTITETKVYWGYPAPTADCGCNAIATGQDIVDGKILSYTIYACKGCVLNTSGTYLPGTAPTCTMIQ